MVGLRLYIFIPNRGYQCWISTLVDPIRISIYTSLSGKLCLLSKQRVYIWIDSRKNLRFLLVSTSDLEYFVACIKRHFPCSMFVTNLFQSQSFHPFNSYFHCFHLVLYHFPCKSEHSVSLYCFLSSTPLLTSFSVSFVGSKIVGGSPIANRIKFKLIHLSPFRICPQLTFSGQSPAISGASGPNEGHTVFLTSLLVLFMCPKSFSSSMAPCRCHFVSETFLESFRWD